MKYSNITRPIIKHLSTLWTAVQALLLVSLVTFAAIMVAFMTILFILMLVINTLVFYG